MDLKFKIRLAFLHAKNFDLYLIIKFISRSANMSEIHILSLKQRIKKVVILLLVIHYLSSKNFKNTFVYQKKNKTLLLKLGFYTKFCNCDNKK